MRAIFCRVATHHPTSATPPCMMYTLSGGSWLEVSHTATNVADLPGLAAAEIADTLKRVNVHHSTVHSTISFRQQEIEFSFPKFLPSRTQGGQSPCQRKLGAVAPPCSSSFHRFKLERSEVRLRLRVHSGLQTHKTKGQRSDLYQHTNTC